MVEIKLVFSAKSNEIGNLPNLNFESYLEFILIKSIFSFFNKEKNFLI
jgi:hypothetical protein